MNDKPTYKELEDRIKALEKERFNNQKNFLKNILTSAPDTVIKEKNLLRALLDTTPDILALKDKKFIYRAVNPAFCNFMQMPESEIIGKTDYDLFSDFDANLNREKDRIVIDTGRPFIQDEELTVGNEKKWLHTVKTPVTDENGLNIGILCSIRDISEKMKTAKELKESVERYKIMYSHLPLPYQSLDVDGSLIDVNPSWERSLGYKTKEVIGKNFADFVAPGYIRVFEKNFPKFLATGEICNVPFKMMKKDGSFIHIELFGKVGYDDNGEFLQTHCVFHDVTRKKTFYEEQEQLIEELKNKLESTKTLQNLLAICSSCKNIRDDKGNWMQLEKYITEETGTLFSHSICPCCIKKLYPEYENDLNANNGNE